MPKNEATGAIHIEQTILFSTHTYVNKYSDFAYDCCVRKYYENPTFEMQGVRELSLICIGGQGVWCPV